MDLRRKLGIAAIGALAVSWMISGSGMPSPKPPSTACETAQLPYNQTVKDQIAELCRFGLPRTEAIEALSVVYRTPGINPDRAVDIVKVGAGVAAMKADPLRYAK